VLIAAYGVYLDQKIRSRIDGKVSLAFLGTGFSSS
jgi:hypothetical protein